MRIHVKEVDTHSYMYMCMYTYTQRAREKVAAGPVAFLWDRRFQVSKK